MRDTSDTTKVTSGDGKRTQSRVESILRKEIKELRNEVATLRGWITSLLRKPESVTTASNTVDKTITKEADKEEKKEVKEVAQPEQKKSLTRRFISALAKVGGIIIGAIGALTVNAFLFAAGVALFAGTIIVEWCWDNIGKYYKEGAEKHLKKSLGSEA